MKKLTLTILHRLPNRVRLKLSVPIKNFDSFEKNITHDIDSAEIDDLLKLAKEEDYWSAGIRETVKKRLEKDKDDVRLDWIVEDLMIKNTGGTVISMPFGKDIITFNSNRHFFRGENQQYLKSVPSLRRRQEGKSKYECELIKGIALMRSLQFAKFIWKIDVVPYWEAKLSDINIDALAQHYGFETCLLDLTNDFRTALFFATCKYDYKTDSYRPLTKKDIEATEDSKYGVIFHSPNWVLDYLNGGSFEWHMRHLNDHREEPYSFYSGELDGMAFQIGYQPLMRCHHQSGYIMPMMNATPLQSDNRFEKIRFLQTEELSNRVYEMMDKGKKIFPYIQKNLDDIITIEDDELIVAFLDMVENHKMIVENSGLLTVAALRHLDVKGKKIVSILSGGNMDVITMSSVVQHGLIQRDRIFTVSVLIPDKPGELVRVASVIARAQGNVIKLDHNQFVSTNRNAAVELKITLEAFGTDHKNEIVKALEDAGCRPKVIRPSL